MPPVSNSKEKKKRIVLLDAHAILHRAYHALPDFISHKGEPTGGLYGLSSMLIRILKDLKPDFVFACYDMPGPTFRHVAYEAYKAKRPKAPEELISQMKRSRDIFRAFGIPIYEKPGFEADDIIGTIVHKLEKKTKSGEFEIIIASGDMDTMQLIKDDRVKVYTLKKGLNDTILYNEEKVKERFSFGPELLPDFKGLRGDPSDNIIGISGIGEKTATDLIVNFGSIEDIYRALKKNPESLLKKGIKERIVKLLEEGEEEALFSKTLASIRLDVPIDFEIPQAPWKKGIDAEKLEMLFEDLNFRSLYPRIRDLLGESLFDIVPLVEEKKEEVSKEEVLETGLALWLLNSDITTPGYEDILHHARTTSFELAKKHIFEELKKLKLEEVYERIELPLIPILKETTGRGIVVDVPYAKELSKKYHKTLSGLETKIWKEAGYQFNINSPKQMGEILFGKLGLTVKGLKKTEGGAQSTRESELLKLQGVHPIIDHILSYRELQKLLSTYVDNIPQMLDGDGVLHTTFVQSGTTTGRMSSQNPNMQNIPARGDYGKEVRSIFVARPHHELLSLDYSQIELRVLAVISKDEYLLKIFKEGKDVHSAVAAEVFGVSEKEVTSDMRRQAKVINFGIIYGMGVTSLQKAIGKTRAEAQIFYDSYFDRFPSVLAYVEHTKEEAARRGYTETLFGRRRYFEGLNSRIPYIRASAERMAVNAPLQGSAADVIKLAMIAVDKLLKEKKLFESAHLLLQVHDELIYEIEKEKIDDIAPLIKHAMEGVIQAEIPFGVSLARGTRWGEMK